MAGRPDWRRAAEAFEEWADEQMAEGADPRLRDGVDDFFSEREAGAGSVLNLTRMDVTWLPPEIGQLSKLESLILNNNALEELPPEIGDLSRLKWLLCSFNKLKRLPPEIGNLSHLEYLDLSNNKLTELPPDLGQLSNLQQLDCAANPLERLPISLVQLAPLVRAGFEGAPFLTGQSEDALVAQRIDKLLNGRVGTGVVQLLMTKIRQEIGSPDITFVQARDEGMWRSIAMHYAVTGNVHDWVYRPLKGNCWTCATIGATMYRCTACHKAVYCGEACQAKDWIAGHHAKCKRV